MSDTKVGREKRIARAIVLLIAALAVGVFVGACGGGGSSSSTASSEPAETGGSEGGETTADISSGGELKLESLLLNTTNPWTATMGKYQQEEGSALGAEVKLLNSAEEAATQVSQIQEAIANHPDGILLNAVDPKGVIPAVEQATSAGIPVVVVNSPIEEEAGTVTYVGANNLEYGEGQGELVNQAIGGKGKVALIQGAIGTNIEAERTKGIEETLAKYPGIEVVSKVTDSWDNSEDIAVVKQLLAKYPEGQLDAIVAEGPEIYVGAEVAHKMGRDDVKFIAGDLPKQVKQSIENGEIYGTVNQDPKTQGDQSVKALVNWINGEKSKVKRPIDYVELPLVTQENVGEYEAAWSW